MYTAPGKGFLQVVGILYVVFAGLGISSALLGMAGTVALGALSGISTLFFVTLLLSSGYGLFLGIIGIRYCNDLSKADFVRTCGLVDLIIRSLIAFFLVGMGIAQAFFGLVLVILFLVGASKNVAAAASMQGTTVDGE